LIAAQASFSACVSQPDCPAVVKDDCSNALFELKRTIPSLLVAVVDEHQRDVADAAVTLDGQPIVLDGSPIEVNPGPHELGATKGTRTRTLKLLAVENQLKRPIALLLESAASGSPPLQSDAAAPLGPERPRVLLIGLGATSLVAGGAFTFFALRGHSDRNELERCKPACAPADVNRVGREYAYADLSLGISIVALAAAGYFYFRSPSAAKPDTSVALDVVPLAGGAFMSVSIPR
jgi:hypothetical protein